MSIRYLLEDRVPETALEYCLSIHRENPFQFRLAKSRSSKLGDFRYDPRSSRVQVTVNEDLNPYQFLITYVHEVAHRYTFNPRKKVRPHGNEWKMQFQQLMLPVLNTQVFPDDVLRVLAKHMKNPKASTASDPALLQVLAKYSPEVEARTTLKNLPLESTFEFRGKQYKKLQEKRTRALCVEVKTRRRYLIPMLIAVE